MKTSIEQELKGYILDKINDGILTNEDKENWHGIAFNEDYYIIGYYNASEWLKRHNIGEFEAINVVRDYEINNFGEFTTEINSEKIVNMLVYIYGEELLYSYNVETVEELAEELTE